jgi:hypothetical protein
MEKQQMQGFERIAMIQQRFWEAGWRWKEETFPDGTVMIQFSPSNNNCAFLIGSSDNEERRYGWGRFKRLTSWTMAEQFLLDEVGIKSNIDQLREYKDHWRKEGCLR